MSQTLTIAGQTFTVEPRYNEGHVLKANEAAALNQTYFENLRNNFASKVNSAVKDGSFDAEKFQAELNEYAESYEFGVRTGGGGRSGDPVRQEAMSIAREMVRDAIRATGKMKLSDVQASAISEAASRLLEDPNRGPKILETARKRVEEQRAVASDLLGDDIMASLSGAASESSSKEAPRKRGRKTAQAAE